MSANWFILNGILVGCEGDRSPPSSTISSPEYGGRVGAFKPEAHLWGCSWGELIWKSFAIVPKKAHRLFAPLKWVFFNTIDSVFNIVEYYYVRNFSIEVVSRCWTFWKVHKNVVNVRQCRLSLLKRLLEKMVI